MHWQNSMFYVLFFRPIPPVGLPPQAGQGFFLSTGSCGLKPYKKGVEPIALEA